jgi:hypothetical protein
MEIYNSELQVKRWFLEFVISFSKIYLGFGGKVWDHVFICCLFPAVKSKNLFWKHLLKSNYYFQEAVVYVQYGCSLLILTKVTVYCPYLRVAEPKSVLHLTVTSLAEV